MASVYHFYFDADRIENEIVTKNLEVEQFAKITHFSALTVQKWWRGYKARMEVKHWHSCAILIQKVVRGWLVRWHLPEILKSYFDFIALNFYDHHATKIQAVWRGYKTRKACDVKKNRKYREHVVEISTQMQSEIRKLFRKNLNMIVVNGEEVENKWLIQCLDALVDRHHLLRTKVREGVLSLHGKKDLSPLEILLKSLPLGQYFRQLKKVCMYHKHKTETARPKFDNDGNIIHPKPFDLNTKLPPRRYQSPLL